MERLLSNCGEYSQKALEIDQEVNDAIRRIVKNYPELDIVDLSLIIQNAASDTMVEMRLDRRV